MGFEEAAGLWLAVLLSGVYHGLNPGMGWPLAVSAALMGRGRRDLLIALGWLAAGHMAAMLLILAPFALVMGLLEWEREIRLSAAVLAIAAGGWLLINRRHPRFLARIAPHRLALWSFGIAMAHGAGLMLAPVYLNLCGAGAAGAPDMGGNIGIALLVALVHMAALALSGGAMALIIHAWLGLAFLRKAWFNLDVVWALSLIAVGAGFLALEL